MKINKRERNGVTIFDIQGRMIGLDASELKYAVDDYLASMAEGEAKILLNLAEVPVMDSSGLAAIVAGYTHTQKKNGQIALLNSGEKVRQLMKVAKLMSIFESYENEEEAIAASFDRPFDGV